MRPHAVARQPQVLPPDQNRLHLNRQQVIEQQELNAQRRVEDEAQSLKTAQRIARAKAPYVHVQSRLGSTQPQQQNNGYNNNQEDMNMNNNDFHNHNQNHQLPNSADDVEISVFVRETEQDGGVFRHMESELVRQNAVENGTAAPSSGKLPQQQQIQKRGNNNNNNNIAAMMAAGGGGGGGGGGAQQQQQQHVYQPSSVQRGGSSTGSHNSGRTPLSSQRDNSNTHHPEPPSGHGNLGNVPTYLRQRKAELQAEKDSMARALEEERERSRHPPGHRPVSEDERLAVLDKLAARKVELERDLQKLPMRFDTIAVQRRRADIEKEMTEVDEAHRRFSVKKQLYVPI